jgi:hypothetical protein
VANGGTAGQRGQRVCREGVCHQPQLPVGVQPAILRRHDARGLLPAVVERVEREEDEDEARVVGTFVPATLDVDVEKVKEVHAQIPKNLNDEPSTNFGNAMGWTNLITDPYKNAYLYIASETYTHGPYKSLTEKVFKPLANFQPFVFLAFPGALGVLKDLGFRTFSPFIDESYDNEPDSARRIQMIYAEIKRLCSMSKEEIHNWYWSMKDILCHNHSHLLELYKNERHSLELIKYLEERTRH